MKTIACIVVAVGAFASPLVSIAQSTAPIARAEVRADLIRVEKAGYNPAVGEDVNYPEDIQAAEAKIATQDNPQMVNNAVGGSTMTGTSAAGSRDRVPKPSASSCVGPASFCSLYFGS